MNQTKKILSSLLLALGVTFFSYCSSSSDPNYAWLMSLASGSTAVTAPTGTTDFGVDINDETTPVDFVFDTTRTITVNIQVLDPVAPVDGSMVQVTVPSATPGAANNKSVFKAYSNTSGEVTGSFTIDGDTNTVHLQVEAYGKFYDADINIVSVTSISRRISISFTANVTQIVDSDGDGVPDSEDLYPLDPSRASTIRIPAEDYYTISFEDLFPKQGDADFNDYVVRSYFEEDLNAAGEVARIRGYFTHVAKGAGYNHTLHFGIPGASVTSYSLIHIGFDGTTVEENLSGVGPTMTDLQVLGNSSTTIPSSNASRSNTTFVKGKTAKLEVILASPISKLILGSAPYDTYLSVINTGKDIHAAGKYFDANGKDIYRDATGFPWYLLVPGNFQWPYEATDIRKSYTQFQPWYQSLGTVDTDWFRNPITSEVFPSTP
ncbi:LruC domain-containing protein [Leptospira semungkisensis]|uniref:LruC domain-containing protein n=1 Tax=Leptospira semungkisensis TaxID=2484985 RepID=A0A4R9G8B2_9LEPT|nr:LruC domain-containing protein [Leptospira semungkisensis]TGK07814.1 LruC domain-containing protein [Leptospira semungkisensis]